MHVMWVSDSPDTPSGFGNVTRFVCDGLAQRGHRVSILGWQSLERSQWRGCEIYPVLRDPLGMDVVYPLMTRLRPDVVATLSDVWWLPYFSAPHVRRQMELTDTPWLLYFPIDGDMTGERLPPSWIELLREVDVPVAMSRYGKRIVEGCGLSCEYIPHGVDLDVFSPAEDREAAKSRVGAEGRFVVLSDCRNQPRKMLPRLLEVFAAFARDKPDALLHLHTNPDDDFASSAIYSYDVREDVRYLGLERCMRFSDKFAVLPGQGLSLDQLAAYYRAADIFLLASTGEGFGLPTLQASAAGVVPLGGGYSATRELVEGHGEAIDIAAWTANEFGIRGALIDVGDAVTKLTRFYDDSALLAERARRSRSFAEAYGWDAIVDQWDALLRSIGQRRHRITRTAPKRSISGAAFATGPRPILDGVSVRVNVVERKYGQLESSILAERRGRSSDVKIPTVPKAAVVGSVKVIRWFGYVGMGAGDVKVFLRLKAIFPALTGWVGGALDTERQFLQTVDVTAAEVARLDVAQSVLLLNVEGDLPEQILVDAAFLGVPCAGTGESQAQRALWPSLLADDGEKAAALARRILTDAAFTQAAVETARTACTATYAPDETAMAACLRRLFAERKSAATQAEEG
ncbi:MAG: glycosyltransferase family 4 protein [Candidatus Tumulicola sp.]